MQKFLLYFYTPLVLGNQSKAKDNVDKKIDFDACKGNQKGR